MHSALFDSEEQHVGVVAVLLLATLCHAGPSVCRLDHLHTQAELYSVGKHLSDKDYDDMMGWLKQRTCATERLVGVQRSAMARRVGAEQAGVRAEDC